MSDVSLCDLAHWELVIIEMYRAWRQEGPTAAIAEHRLAVNLRAERIYPLVDTLFDLFALISSTDIAHDSGAEALSPAEKLLLDIASGAGPAEYPPAPPEQALKLIARSMRAGLSDTGVSLRPSLDIPPSEEGRLEQAVAASYRVVFRMT